MTMNIVVQKYGGSSLADTARIHAVAADVARRQLNGERLVVVVSAMGKTTDRLIAQAREITATPSRRELDMLVTAGERISMALMSMAIHEAGAEAVSFTGSQSGIITENQHQGARITEVRPMRIVEALEAGKVVIVAGYQGVSREREITTLGRGGTDTSAVAIAAALGATACEIYSDVDGVYSADPRLCEQAKILGSIDYTTMELMAGAGAKVLNADAVEFAKRAGITILARKTGDRSGRQTKVSVDAPPHSGVAAVVSATAVSEVSALPNDLDAGALIDALVAAGGRIISGVHTHERFVLVDRTDIAAKDPAVVAGVAERYACRCREVVTVTLIGANLLRSSGFLQRVRTVLDAATISVRHWLADDRALRLVLESEHGDEAVRLLHDALVA